MVLPRSLSFLTIAYTAVFTHLKFQVAAQSTNATCILASLQWAFNSQKQSPCEVASSLFGVCANGAYSVQALPDQTHYLGPTIDGANPCQCNTVSYSLISACALCQNRTIITWSEWSTNCASVSISGFPEPLPVGLHVPGWAYLDVETEDTFDENAAQQDANATESTAIPLAPSSTTHLSSHSTSATLASVSVTNTPTPSTSDEGAAAAAEDRRSNAIGGGIVGALFGVTFICILSGWLYCVRRRRLRATRVASEEVGVSDSPVVSEHPKEGPPTVIISDMPSVPFYQNTASTLPVSYSASTMSSTAQSQRAT